MACQYIKSYTTINFKQLKRVLNPINQIYKIINKSFINIVSYTKIYHQFQFYNPIIITKKNYDLSACPSTHASNLFLTNHTPRLNIVKFLSAKFIIMHPSE